MTGSRFTLPQLSMDLAPPCAGLENHRARYRSVLICHRGSAIDREGLSRWLAGFSTLVGIVELDEPPGRTWQRVRREIRRSGVWRFLDVLAFRAYYRVVHAAADRRWEAEATRALAQRFARAPACTNVLRARSVNAPEVVRFLTACSPDFAVARCKTLLRPAVFNIPRAGTYVLHPGICPEYRNAHGCFWALAARDLSNVGLTLLRIDDGVDTGPVYGYFRCDLDERRESHARIQMRVLLENLDAIRMRLLEAVAGTALPLDTSGRPSAVWGQPWLTAYLRWKGAARGVGRHADAHAAVPRRSA